MARIVLLDYATRRYRFAQWLNAHSALEVGGIDVTWRRSPRHLDRAFRRKNAQILESTRGSGYWLWKPYLVLRALEQLAPDDVLLYSDACVVFLQPVKALVDLCLERHVVPFELPFLESAWTKRDAFVLLGCDDALYSATRQRHASYFLLRRSRMSLDLATSWLEAAQDPRLLTDAPNTCGLGNHPDFQEHRHDQSLWSLLTKKAEIRAFRDPGKPFEEAGGAPGSFPRLLDHTRRRKIPRRYRFRAAIGWPP